MNAARKTSELQRKLASLSEEFAAWHELSEARHPLEKHQSQIRRVTAQLGALVAELSGEINATAGQGDGVLLRESVGLERKILEVHQVWEFFRSKLALRQVEFFQPYLRAVDELAWAAYKPARQRYLELSGTDGRRVKEPPLVFLTSGASPFEISRERSFRDEVPGRFSEAVRRVLESLPIPIVGVPWYQVSHLPDALVVGHEIGHVVEHDLRLTGTLERLVASCALADDHLPAWQAWAGEVFADVYGTLTTGPAFAGTLIDFLAADGDAVAGEWSDASGVYPTSYLRVLLALHVLDRLGFHDDAATLEKDWREAYPEHALAGWEDDVPRVADALLDGPYPELGEGEEARLTSVLAFSKKQQKKALDDVERLLLKGKPSSADARIVFAAARLVFQKQPDRPDPEIRRRILEHVQAHQEVGPRGEIQDRDVRVSLAEADRGSGPELLRLLSRAE